MNTKFLDSKYLYTVSRANHLDTKYLNAAADNNVDYVS